MKNWWRLAITALIVLNCWTATADAETRYVTDQLVVSLREQPQQGAQSITYLRTDVPVEVLEETGDFVKVKSAAGEIGYIKQNYLTPKTPKAVIITQLQKERDRLAAKIEEMQKELARAASQDDKTQHEMTTQLAESNRQVSDLKKNLEVSQATLVSTNQSYQALQRDARDVINISKERDQLRKTNQELTTTVASLQDEVESLTMTGLIKWFLAGGGVLFLGWMIGKLSSGRRRSRL